MMDRNELAALRSALRFAASRSVINAAEERAIWGLIDENARLREALEPFANPPLYVFDDDARYVPTPQPDAWIGGGWFSTDDFRRARAALNPPPPDPVPSPATRPDG